MNSIFFFCTVLLLFTYREKKKKKKVGKRRAETQVSALPKRAHSIHDLNKRAAKGMVNGENPIGAFNFSLELVQA